MRTAVEALFDDRSVHDSVPSIARRERSAGSLSTTERMNESDSPWDEFPSAAFGLPETPARKGHGWLEADRQASEATTEAEGR